MDTLKSLKKNDSVLTQLTQAILDGLLPEGEEVTQNEISESLGVSRMPVREALSILEYKGLIEKLPNQHVRVVQFSEQFFDDIFSIASRFEFQILKSMDLQPCSFENEMNFHKYVISACNNSYIVKNFSAFTDVYIPYALQSDNTSGIPLIQDVLEKLRNQQIEESAAACDEYFRTLSVRAWKTKNKRICIK